MVYELAKTDELELVYTHLVSMENFKTMADRLLEVNPSADEDAGQASDVPTATSDKSS